MVLLAVLSSSWCTRLWYLASESSDVSGSAVSYAYAVHSQISLADQVRPALILPVVYFLTPYTALFPSATARYIALALIMLFKGFGIIIAFPSTTILLTNSCTSVRILGTLNGFATCFSGLGRGAGPLLTGLAFTWGVERGYVLVPYAFLAIIAAIGAIPVFLIVDGDGPSATPDESDHEDEGNLGDSAVILPNESAIDEVQSEDEQAPLLSNNQAGYKSVDNRQ